jgi:hypothetical protein
VGKDRNIPPFGEDVRSADVVEVAVGEHDPLGPRPLAEAPRDRPADEARRPGEARVDEQPCPSRLPEREDVDEQDPKPPHPLGYGLEHTYLLAVTFHAASSST